MRHALCCLLLALPAPFVAATEAPVHHALSVTLDPASRTLRGIDTVTLRRGNVTGFALRRGFTVDRLVVDGQPQEPLGRDGRIALALAERPTHEILIEYRAELTAPPNGTAPSGPVAGPQGSFLPAAGWFPDLGGPFTYELTVDVPDPQRAVTSGRLTSETTADGRYRATFSSEVAVVELSLFAGPWRIAERIHRGWRLRAYFDDAVVDLADTYLERIASYLDLYDGWIGTYPYSGFAVVSGPFPVGWGFPGLTYLGTRVIRSR